jgi:hypothetical protein
MVTELVLYNGEWDYYFSDHDKGNKKCFMCDNIQSPREYPKPCVCGYGLVHRQLVCYEDTNGRGYTDIWLKCDNCDYEEEIW